MADSFATRFAAVRSRYGPLALGLDPSGPILDAWGIGDSPDGVDRFAEIALEAAAGTVGLVKFQAAFYERHGWQGFRTLQRLISEAHSAGLLAILDAKRGDVGTTNDAYAEAYLGAGVFPEFLTQSASLWPSEVVMRASTRMASWSPAMRVDVDAGQVA
jgi:orotidine-5'-phosphate decarboxylase